MPSLINSYNFKDPDALAFINAAVISSVVQQNAINQLVLSLKGKGLWTKMNAIYPFVGGTASTHKWNLKNPLDTDAAYRLVFNGGWTHSSTGSDANGTNAYANTYFNLQSLVENDAHISIYQKNNYTPPGGASIDIGAFREGGSEGGAFIATEVVTNLSRGRMFLNALNYTSSDNRGYYIVKSDATDTKYYINNVNQSTIANSGNFPLESQNIYIGALNSSGNSSYYAAGLYAFASLGSGLTNTQATDLYTVVQTYQTALSRQI